MTTHLQTWGIWIVNYSVYYSWLTDHYCINIPFFFSFQIWDWSKPKGVKGSLQLVRNSAHTIFFGSLSPTLSFSLPSFNCSLFPGSSNIQQPGFPNKVMLWILAESGVSLPGYSCSFFVVYITKYFPPFFFFLFPYCYLCSLLFLAQWKACWLSPRQKKNVQGNDSKRPLRFLCSVLVSL